MNQDRSQGESVVPVVNVDFIGYKQIVEITNNIRLKTI